MQLDLFEDNRSGILLNMADEFTRARDFAQAISVYEQLLADYPGDRHSAALLKLVSEWQAALSEMNLSDPEIFRSIWLRFETLSHPPLRTIVLGILIEEIRVLPNPERIYIPPRIHLGHLLMEAGRYAEAADCFFAALSDKDIPRGRFLAWRGDALTLAKKDADALKSYLEAFLADPLSVDIQSVKNLKITSLLTILSFEALDDIDEDHEQAWLPVWGWLQGIFALPLQAVTGADPFEAKSFEALLAEENCSVPRIWFDMLTHAERVRVLHRDDRELAAVRRLMKKTNGFMFDCYLEKIGGRR
ncbi:MAG: tetratricopeptide repeat protein [Steroidobacteraceae bacterium]|nr:tetratricopeptide repeat protein [Deltaproteobacteria bacterium]